jgi:Protein of unknown function (DUF1302)
MGRIGRRTWVLVCGTGALLMLWQATTQAISVDKEGDIHLGLRSYVNARVGTETTHDGVILDAGTPNAVSDSGTFPHSDSGHLRQNRAFVEIEWTHHLERLLKEDVGPFSLLNDLPFKIKNLEYRVTFRGEGDGLYDWGPNEYSTAVEFNKSAAAQNAVAVIPGLGGLAAVDVAGTRKRLRHLGTDRERLFQAFVQMATGDLTLRVGRQILAWGETDVFQLLDHINPIDNSFGGFLIPLDERRVPLDMAVANYYLGDFGPISESYVEAFGAIDNKVGYLPGTPQGSPWAPPSLGNPSSATETLGFSPARTIGDARGGARVVFDALGATFTVAHYYTYFDLPVLQVFTPPGGILFRGQVFDDHQPCANGMPGSCGFPTHTIESAPKVQVDGASTTFAIPQFYSVLRSEFAYFKDEPAYTQRQLDPFLFDFSRDGMTKGGSGADTGGTRTRDSINFALGLDTNQYIRFLNPTTSFFFSTQFFYKHIQNGGSGNVHLDHAIGRIPAGAPNPDREVLPVQLLVQSPPKGFTLAGGPPVEPVYISQPTDQFLQTLLVSTSYRSGTVNPAFAMFYDWGGSLLYQPGVTFIHDPFRFTIDYSIIDSHIYKGGSGVSLLKDRDNVEFRFDYVI